MTTFIDDATETFNNLTLSDKENIQEGEIIIDPDVPEDNTYKYIQRIGDNIVKRNNNDPNLTPDGLPTVDHQLAEIQKRDSQLNIEKPIGLDNLIKLRCVVMDHIGLSPLTDSRFLSSRQKEQYIRYRDTYSIDLTQVKLDEDFSKICHSTIFECGEDVSKYPIYL
jgi:hypothetical protein